MADAQFSRGAANPRGQSTPASSLTTNQVLRNTYMLLSMTLLFSAAMAGISMAMGAPHFGILTFFVAIGLFFAIHRMRNSGWGIALVFVLTGFLGFSLGPVISLYLSLPGGSEIVMTSMGLTGLIFLSLSWYTLATRKDFSFMAGFLMTGLVVMLGGILLLWLGPLFGFHVPGLHLALSAFVVLLMSGLILFDTSRIIHGGETNYVMATVSLYLSIYNLFVSLLHLVGVFSED